ncbi:MAG TPA: RNA polymerase sigma factor [Ardenticatenaceae bacterium]
MEGSLVTYPGLRKDSAVLVSALFEKWSTPVAAYVYRLVGDWEVAHDLTQEVFLRVFNNRHQLEGVENQRAWVYRIATNVAFDYLRRRRRFAWLPWRSDQTASLPEPMATTEEVDQRVAVERALAHLPPDYRAPLLLYGYYGFSVREVARALDISEGAVKTRLYRARELFRQVYEKEV